MATNSAGIRITQAGVSAQFAADYQYVFNSDWPSLAIAFETVQSVGPYGSVTVPHGLGFYPLTMGWTMLNGVSIGRTFGVSGNLNSNQNVVSLAFDKDNIYLSSADGSVTYDIVIRCYNIDISKNVDYTLPHFPTVPNTYDPSTGIKVSKNGKSIVSKDLRDFVLHSRAQSPAVLSIVTDVTLDNNGQKTIGYNNPAGYMPWVLAFTSGPGQDDYYYPLAPGSQQNGYEFSIKSLQTAKSEGIPQNAIYASLLSNPNNTFGSLVVLRDPLVVAKTKRVVY